MLSNHRQKCAFFTVSDCNSADFVYFDGVIRSSISAPVTQADVFTYKGKTLVIAYVPLEITAESPQTPSDRELTS